MESKPTKRIAIVDCGDPARIANGILNLLAPGYEFAITTDFDADYEFHSCMGNIALKYSGVRIFINGE